MTGRLRSRSAWRSSLSVVCAAVVLANGVHAPADAAMADPYTLLPMSERVSDATGGLGPMSYRAGQALAGRLSTAVVTGANLTALARAAGLDPRHLANAVLAGIPSKLVPGVLAAVAAALPVPVVKPVLDQVNLGFLAQILASLHVADVTDGTLAGLLASIGLKPSDPFDVSDVDVPGFNVITAGEAFSALKLIGPDFGWVPAVPDSVAADINESRYLEAGADGVLHYVLRALTSTAALLGGPGRIDLSGLRGLTGRIPDLLHARVVPTIGIGLGAFAAAMAYSAVADDLKRQPGGSAYAAGTNPLLGSLTMLPLLLIDDPARPDGGLFARFGSLAALLGIDTVGPTTHASSENGFLALGTTGLTLGGANLLPVLVDVTTEYQPLSDFASWPNPVTLVNNLSAALWPTYRFRGLQVDAPAHQIVDRVTTAVGAAATGKPLALNTYVTLPSSTLPMLEPLNLASDALGAIGLTPLADIPRRLAHALSPALTTLVDIGYANAYQHPDGTITRDSSTAGTETPFLSFPHIDYGRALRDSAIHLVDGFRREFLGGSAPSRAARPDRPGADTGDGAVERTEATVERTEATVVDEVEDVTSSADQATTDVPATADPEGTSSDEAA